jgi:mannosyl-oligosaccharide alpha-1,2-mannosidase
MSVFETNIRVMGGLLSAHWLATRDDAGAGSVAGSVAGSDAGSDWRRGAASTLLAKARDLGDRMLPAFKTATGIPKAQIALGTGSASNSWTGRNAVLAELGTLQVEWRYLSYWTKDPKYRRAVERIYDTMRVQTLEGMYPTMVNRDTGGGSGSVYSFGGLADSFFEYLLKMWLQGDRTEPRWREMYDASVQGLFSHLARRSLKSNLLYVSQKRGGSLDRKMEHLTCFVGGMLAMGAHTDPTSGGPGAESERARRDGRAARALAYTCYQMYARSPVGLSAEHVTFSTSAQGDDFGYGGTPYYILRPEAAETLYVLHEYTRHPVLRQWAWEMFTAIEKNCRTQYGFGNYPNVTRPGATPDDRAESFFLAETLKYLYLIQLPRGEGRHVDLAREIFNTEAHPLGVFKGGWSGGP